LTSGIDQLEDSFIFDLMDKKPNLIPGNVFHIMWSVIGFEKLEFNVTETAGVIRLPVVRQGNVKQVYIYVMNFKFVVTWLLNCEIKCFLINILLWIIDDLCKIQNSDL